MASSPPAASRPPSPDLASIANASSDEASRPSASPSVTLNGAHNGALSEVLQLLATDHPELIKGVLDQQRRDRQAGVEGLRQEMRQERRRLSDLVHGLASLVREQEHVLSTQSHGLQDALGHEREHRDQHMVHLERRLEQFKDATKDVAKGLRMYLKRIAVATDDHQQTLDERLAFLEQLHQKTDSLMTQQQRAFEALQRERDTVGNESQTLRTQFNDAIAAHHNTVIKLTDNFERLQRRAEVRLRQVTEERDRLQVELREALRSRDRLVDRVQILEEKVASTCVALRQKVDVLKKSESDALEKYALAQEEIKGLKLLFGK